MRELNYNLSYFVMPFFVGILLGFGFGHYVRGKTIPPSIHVSQTALQEIGLNPKCSGQQRDLAVNRKYVYANCPGGPVTVQNYRFK